MLVGKLKTNDFKDLRFKGSTFKTSHFLFVYSVVDDSEADKIFFGSTVTKKVGNAVLRNKCKRIIREAMRFCLTSLKFSNSTDQKSFKALYLNIVVLQNSKGPISYIHASKQISKFFKSLKFSS